MFRVSGVTLVYGLYIYIYRESIGVIGYITLNPKFRVQGLGIRV